MSGYNFFIALTLFTIAFLLESVILINFATIAWGATVCHESYRQKGIESIDVIFMFLISSCLASIGNILAILSKGQTNESIYFLYTIPEYITEASIIHFWGTLFISVGFKVSKNWIKLPKIAYVQMTKDYAPLLLLVAIGSIYLIANNLLSISGTLASYLKLTPVFFIFFLSRFGANNKSTRIKNYAFLIVIIETVRALFYEYLRMNIVLPTVAYFLGLVIGERQLRTFFTFRFYVIYGFAILSISYFTVFGQLRSTHVSGLDRISMLQESEIEQENTLWSRVSNLNQLTNVVDLAESNGHYNGSTLNYFVYALIPRFLWPEKPIIAKGRWFALEIGQAYEREAGVVNNSINMTVPGEFYLNFNWSGLILGSLLFGVFIRVLWNTTQFWVNENGIFSSIFGFYLLFIGLFSLGADLQVVITLIAVYLITYFLSIIFKAIV